MLVVHVSIFTTLLNFRGRLSLGSIQVQAFWGISSAWKWGVWWGPYNCGVGVTQDSIWNLFQNSMFIQKPRPCEGAQQRMFGRVSQRFWKGDGLFSGVSGSEGRYLSRLIQFHWKCRTLALLGAIPFPSLTFLTRSLFALRSHGALTHSTSNQEETGSSHFSSVFNERDQCQNIQREDGPLVPKHLVLDKLCYGRWRRASWYIPLADWEALILITHS